MRSGKRSVKKSRNKTLTPLDIIAKPPRVTIWPLSRYHLIWVIKVKTNPNSSVVTKQFGFACLRVIDEKDTKWKADELSKNG